MRENTDQKKLRIWIHFTQSLLFLICINDVSEVFPTNVRLFAENVSLFSVDDNINLAATNLNSDLIKINVWVNGK